jgi:segregation and condensation protein B
MLPNMDSDPDPGAAPTVEEPPVDEIGQDPVTPESEPESEAGQPEASQPESEPESEAAAPEPPVETTPAREVSDEVLEREIAALLLASPDPLSTARMRSLVGGVETARVDAALEALGSRMETAELPWELRSIAGGWQLYTTTDMTDVVTALAKVRKEEKVSPAALETLAVVAYRQPVTKAEIEAIRGVQAGPVLRALVDRGMLKVAGRAEVPGHPLLYATTKKFLDSFGLMKLEDLPRDSELLKD